jgi:hypothetical protein
MIFTMIIRKINTTGVNHGPVRVYSISATNPTAITSKGLTSAPRTESVAIVAMDFGETDSFSGRNKIKFEGAIRQNKQ